MAGFGDAPLIQKLAVPGVCILISFLAYSSQLLFFVADLKPGPLTRAETLQFNALLLCLWYTYYKACTVDPGRFTFSSPVLEVPSSDDGFPSDDDEQEADNIEDGEEARLVKKKKKGNLPRSRWCRKCAAPKPPRAHHCRTCNRCIPKMDHHCPWTGNCVSLATFPHFYRFLLYANLSLWYLAALLFRRFAALWADRNLPAYLGPSMLVLVHLSLLLPISFFTTLGLGIMFYATSHDWLENTTTIEGFEIHRHNEIVERDNRGGAWWSARAGHDDDDDSEDPDVDPADRPIKVEKVEFPYDIGYWANLTQAMGSSNPLVWILPWSGAPAVSTTEGKGLGWEWEENGFNDTEGLWPPPDPEKRAPRRGNGRRRAWPGARGSDDDTPAPPQYASRDEEIQAFRKRQEDDLRRREETRARLMAELEEVADFDPVPIPVDDYDDDDVPLAELIRQRKIRRRDDQDE